MATVSVQVAGGALALKQASTIAELKQLLGVQHYTATVNGEPQDNDYSLSEGEFVTLAAAVKGARVILRKAK
jgi:hypothetical protein